MGKERDHTQHTSEAREPGWFSEEANQAAQRVSEALAKEMDEEGFQYMDPPPGGLVLPHYEVITSENSSRIVAEMFAYMDKALVHKNESGGTTGETGCDASDTVAP